MTTDVGTTKRKPLTPTQRLKLFEREKGLCCICGLKIVGRFVDEHKRALALGGGNEMTNRGVAHPKCAAAKTHDKDMPSIVKAKAQKRAQHAIKAAPTKKIESPGFTPVAEKKNTVTAKARLGIGRWYCPLRKQWFSY